MIFSQSTAIRWDILTNRDKNQSATFSRAQLFSLTNDVLSYTFELMKVRNMEIFEIHASYCAVLASAKRLAIMACLDKKEMSVGELADTIGSPLSTVSRHLTLLKSKHLVESRKDGTTVFYRPADKRIMAACAAIRAVLFESMQKRGDIAQEINLDKLII